MGRKFKPVDRDQSYLLPPSLRDWVAESDLVWFVIDLVGELDLSGIYRHYEVRVGADGRERAKAASGQPPYDPKMMTTLLLYGYCLGVTSSRRIEVLCERDAGFRIAAANQHPDHDTICQFRRIHLEALAGLFVQVLSLARKAGLVKLGHVALDGTKVRANASKHKAMSYERMVQREEQYAREVEALLKQAEETDAAEDALYGKDRRGDELPGELKFKQKRLAKIREAKRALEEEAKEKARAEGRLDENDEPIERKGGRKPQTPPGEPKPKAQRNFTDPDSRIMKTASKSFDQCYNCQAAVDSEAQIIVAAQATNAPNDKQQVEPMVEQIEENTGRKPKEMSADSGYYSRSNVEHLRAEGVDDYVCPDKLRHGQEPPKAVGRIPAHMSFMDRVRRKLLTKKGRATYGRRKGIVEPVFGQTKQGRGLRQFLLRGLEKADGEWKLWCLTHNVLKMWRSAMA